MLTVLSDHLRKMWDRLFDRCPIHEAKRKVLVFLLPCSHSFMAPLFLLVCFLTDFHPSFLPFFSISCCFLAFSSRWFSRCICLFLPLPDFLFSLSLSLFCCCCCCCCFVVVVVVFCLSFPLSFCFSSPFRFLVSQGRSVPCSVSVRCL